MSIQKGFSKRDFSVGQYDREYQAAQDDISSRGMIYSRNLISSPLREIKTRPGTRLIKSLQGPAKIIPFRIESDDISLIFEDNTISGWEFDENFEMKPYLLFSGEGPIMPTGNWTSNTNGSWSVSFSPTNATNMYPMLNANTKNFPLSGTGTRIPISSVPVTGRDSVAYLYLTNNDGPVIFRSVIVRFVYNTIFVNKTAPIVYKGWKNAVIQYSDDNVTWTSIRTTQQNPNGKGSVFQTATRYQNNGRAESNVIFRVVNSDSDLTSHKYWRIFFRDIVSQGRDGVDNFWSFDVILTDEDMINGQTVKGPQFVSNVSAPYVIDNSGISLNDISNIKYSQADNNLLIAMKDRIPYQINYSFNSFVSGNFTPSETPDIWTEQGYPTCVRHFSNRLWFGGLSEQVNRIISSKFGDYQDFKQPTGEGTDVVNAASPIIADCNQLRSKITDLFGGWDVLYCQSEEGIATASAGNTAIAPNNMEFLLKVNKRSGGVTPTVKDNLMFYVSSDRKSIYAIQFDLFADKYQVSDVTKFSNSYLESGIRGIYYVDTKESMIYGHLDNGQIFAFLYDIESRVVGLFPLETDGFVYDMSVVQANGQVRLIAVIQRNGVWGVEIFNPVEDLLDTSEFVQSKEAQNEATKLNLTNQPFIDYAVTSKNEKIEEWSFNAETSILSSSQGSSHTAMSENMQKTVRFITSSNIKYDLKIVGIAGLYEYNVEVEQGDSSVSQVFTRLQFPQETITTLIPNKVYQYFDTGRYMGDIKSDDEGVLKFKNPVYDCTYGLGYIKIGVIQDNQTYLRKKKWGAIAINIMDTMSLKIGSKIDRLEDVMNWRGNDFYDSSPIMRNGILVSNIADEPENDKQLIFMTAEGLPFTIRAIEAAGEITDRNQN